MDDIIQRIVKSLHFDSRTGRRNNSKQRNTVNESERGSIMSKPHITRIYRVHTALFEKKTFLVLSCYKEPLLDEDKKAYVFTILIFEKFDCFLFCFQAYNYMYDTFLKYLISKNNICTYMYFNPPIPPPSKRDDFTS